MRSSAVIKIAVIVAIIAVSVHITGRVVNAQGVLGRLKKAAEDAGRVKQPAPQPTTPQQPPPQQQTPTGRQNAASSDAATGDCCSPEAMKRIASTAGFLDIGGIKLGMTPEEAMTAVKAFNAKMKIDVLNARMEPPDAPGTFVRVPQFIIARTPPPPAAGSDAIEMEFSLPPSPPVVIKIIREVTFPPGQPVVASTLIDGLRKKYGQEMAGTPIPMLT